MSDDLLRELAKDLPFERPTAARRDAVRSSLLVEAAESTRAVATTRRWPIAVGFAAGALAAAAIAVLVLRRPAPVIERANLAQVTASADVRIDHQIIATEHGSDEIVRIREGTIALAIPAQRRGDRMIVKTTTADVEGDAGELEVVVANEQLQSVRVKSGTARVVVLGQTSVTLSAGQVWRASVITADLTPAPSDKPARPGSDSSTANPPASDPTAPASTSTTSDPPNAPTTSSTAPRATATNDQPASGRTIASATTPATRTDPASTATNALPGGTATRTTPGSTTTPRTSATPATRTGSVATTTAPRIPATSTGPTNPVATPATTPAVATPTSPVATSTDPATEPEAPPAAKPASIEQRFQRGWALLRAGKAQQAADELGAAADASPTSPLAADARYFQAVSLVRANDPRTAERVLVQFLDTAPTSLRRGRAAILLGRLLAERGDPKTARAWLETAASDPDPAIAGAAKAGLQALPR